MRNKKQRIIKSTKNLIKHPLFSGSAIMIIGSNSANFIAYLYHLVIGRMLGPISYGELAATLAALGMFSTAFAFISLVIVKFVSSAKKQEVPALYRWFMKKGLIIGLGFCLLLIVFASKISDFLHIDYKIAFLIGPILFAVLLSLLLKSFLQGLLKFGQLVAVTNIDMGLRVLFSVSLVYFGFSSFGAVFGIFVASILSFLVAFSFLKELRQGKVSGKLKNGKKVLAYAFPVFLISIANNSFISSDVILTKHFFNAYDAGIYAALSALGKIIFFGTGPVGAVMFPIISKRHSRGQSYRKILLMSFLLTIWIAITVLAIYYFLPELMINILFGSEFLDASNYLIWFGIFIAVYTVANLIVSFYLSIGKTKVAFIPITFALFQIIGIYFFHDSILSVIKISTLSAVLLLTSLLIYFRHDQQKKNKIN
ncbi:oligosaccharide flippase family protein [Patescibacteria group bacterium]|nr:oligosaccharide flippase family protein [Patescibacteria group bacterium]